MFNSGFRPFAQNYGLLNYRNEMSTTGMIFHPPFLAYLKEIYRNLIIEISLLKFIGPGPEYVPPACLD